LSFVSIVSSEEELTIIRTAVNVVYLRVTKDLSFVLLILKYSKISIRFSTKLTIIIIKQVGIEATL
jgi:hypothetical protein